MIHQMGREWSSTPSNPVKSRAMGWILGTIWLSGDYLRHVLQIYDQFDMMWLYWIWEKQSHLCTIAYFSSMKENKQQLSTVGIYVQTYIFAPNLKGNTGK